MNVRSEWAKKIDIGEIYNWITLPFFYFLIIKHTVAQLARSASRVISSGLANIAVSGPFVWIGPQISPIAHNADLVGRNDRDTH